MTTFDPERIRADPFRPETALIWLLSALDILGYVTLMGVLFFTFCIALGD